jgi:GntR family transcriptional regulator
MTDDAAIDPYSHTHAYQQITDTITERIANGRYYRKLPSELDLAREFGVAVITVRHAIAILRERGLVVSVHGRGTFIAPSVLKTRPSPPPMAELTAYETPSEMKMPSDTPTGPAQPDHQDDGTDLETTLRNAEQFLIKSGEIIHPDLSPRTLLRYITMYRTHLSAVVTATRREQGPGIGQPA